MLVDRIKAAEASKLAAVDSRGGSITYAELIKASTELSDELGEKPQLVLLEASSTVEWLVAYIACMMARHPVIMAPKGASETIAKLSSAFEVSAQLLVQSDYKPNFLKPTIDQTCHPDLALMLSTSGSTGSAKCVKLSHANLSANAKSICEYLQIDASHAGVANLPTHYSYGLSVVNSHLHAGATVLLTDESVIEDSFWAFLHEHNATSFQGVPHVYELLHRVNLAARAPASLSYFTQAGGKLQPNLVHEFAQLAKANDWRFFVMYGQTEATARMAYLPPEKLADNTKSIGIAIPGGQFQIVDEQNQACPAGTIGELVYEGPNVMMGYATSAADLAALPMPPRLKTGDLARRDEQGLYYLTGRLSRFVKIFGNRIGLDDVENTLADKGFVTVVTGVDEHLLVATTHAEHEAGIRELIAAKLKLPKSHFTVKIYEEYPLLASGKIDYQSLKQAITPTPEKPSKIGFVKNFFFPDKADTSGLSIQEIYCDAFGAEAKNPDNTFRSLGGDSLNYVRISAALEQRIASLPKNWDCLSIAELNKLEQGSASQAISSSKPIHENFDTLRAIACLMVVIYHVVGLPSFGLKQTDGPLRWLVDSFEYFRMPLFMAMAGFFYAFMPAIKDSLVAFIKKRFVFLMVPAITATLIYWGVRRVTYGLDEPLLTQLLHGYLHMWFLYALMLIMVFVALVDALFKPNTWFWAAVVFIAPVVAQTMPFIGWLSVNQAAHFLCFFALGLLVGRQPSILQNQTFVSIAIVLALVSIVHQQVIMLGLADIPDWAYMRYIGGCSVLIAMIRLVPRIDALASISIFTYTIYLWHPLANAVMRTVLQQVHINNLLILLVCGTIAGVLGPIILYRIIQPAPRYLNLLLLGKQ